MYEPARCLTVRRQVLLGLMARRRHDRLVIIQRQHVENHFGGRGTTRAEESLGVASAILELEPHEHWFLGLANGLGDLRRHFVGQRQRCRHRGAEAHELTPRDASSSQFRRQPSALVAHRSPMPSEVFLRGRVRMRAQSAPAKGMRSHSAGRIEGTVVSSSWCALMGTSSRRVIEAVHGCRRELPWVPRVFPRPMGLTRLLCGDSQECVGREQRSNRSSRASGKAGQQRLFRYRMLGFAGAVAHVPDSRQVPVGQHGT